ncbi:unannotated protein [freshwater metagenome]|uniref:Unannotated protein n=1 Tax=freshwater metagenome TaxID=449393 RepID=A0A6J6XK52_9ZZZZ
MAQGLFYLRNGEPHLGVGAVEHQIPVFAWIVQEVQRLEGQLEVLEGWNIERGDQGDRVAGIKSSQDLVIKSRRSVNYDVVKHVFQQRQNVRNE